jgi:murein DD-endopeptidase MepM/ murein hydrolase activator NlpD
MPALHRPPALSSLALLIVATCALALAGASSLGQAVPEAVPLAEVAEALAPPAEPDPPAAAALTLHLPTSNRAVLYGDEGAFYSPLDKERIPGLRRFGWEGGRYGFVRNEARTPAGPVFTRLHQGVDIRPVYRDARGEPQDTVRAIAAGTVVYANHVESRSSYGLYVVVRHEWEGSDVYSLSAHLESIWVRPGDSVGAGSPLGRMGWTGRGTARHRAHLHLEIGLMINGNYPRWHDASFTARNWHGIFNGMNFRGVDVAALYLALQEEPELTFSAFMLRKPVAYRLALPGSDRLDLLERYPWLAEAGVSGADVERPGAWVVGFSREGVPVEIGRQAAPVREPEVVFVAPEVRQRHLSLGSVVSRTPRGYELSRSGRGYAALLATGPDGLPSWF